MKIKNRDSAFTLVELLVTVLIASLVSAMALWIWFEATHFNIRSRAQMNTAEQAQQILNILGEDFSRMGVAPKMTEFSTSISLSRRIFWGDTTLSQYDSSSFAFVNQNGLDQISFKAMSFNKNGQWEGIDSVTYIVNSEHELVRKLKKINSLGVEVSRESVVVVDQVQEFNIILGNIFGIQDSTSYNIPLNTQGNINSNIANYSLDSVAQTITFNRFHGNSVLDTFEVQFPQNYTISSSSSYLLEYTLSPNQILSKEFNSSSDTLALVLKSNRSQDFFGWVSVYPGPSQNQQKRSFDFSSGILDTLASSFRFVFKSSKPDSITQRYALTLSGLRILPLSRGLYSWDTTHVVGSDSISCFYKKNTKAIRINMILRKIVGRDTILFESKKTVSLPNNGLKI